uniref:Sortase n=1 Tax=candidate division WWE3 bacterium TaxID=2053526 RepID=A0A7C4TJF9_UNCKA
MAYFRPYKYVKDESRDPIYKTVNKNFFLRSIGYPILFIILGVVFTLTQIVIPVISIETQDEVAKPVSYSVVGVASGFRKFEFSELNKKQAVLGESISNTTSEDFLGVMGSSTKNANVPEFYYLTIPKLGIKNAKVESRPKNLDPDKALGHYAGSSFPGESGNAFIYGHSVLPAFYNPRNYKSIFSTLSSLDVGDQFTIEYNNKTYKYAVEGKKTLKPDEVDPLATFKPSYLNESTVTLMTCSPAGTKLKRLLVYASLVE